MPRAASTPPRSVDALYKAFGNHHIRAIHAKGIVLEGHFSYATLSYYGVNAFKFTDAAGKSHFVRYRFIPKAGEQFVPAAEVQAKAADYLQEEIHTRLAKGPAEFEWFAQISGKGDKVDDPSVAWPEDRQLVKLGTLTVEHVAQNQSALEKTLLFLPSNVPAGIEPADPMIQIRSAAYPVSFGDRQ